MTDDREQHGPLEAYQWSAARIDAQTRTQYRVRLILESGMCVALLVVIIWAVAVFGSGINTIRAQQVQFHQDTVSRDAQVECGTKALDVLLTEFAEADAAQKAHQPTPNFVIPKPC